MPQQLTIDRIERRLTTPRAAGVAGVLFALLFGASLVILRLALPEALLAQAAWTAQQATSVSLAATLAPFAGITFLWFLGVIRDRLGDLYERTLVWRSDQPQSAGLGDSGTAVTHTQLAVYALRVLLDRYRRQNKALGDFFVWEPFGQQDQDVDLAIGQ
jgi:hypothetical protein